MNKAILTLALATLLSPAVAQQPVDKGATMAQAAPDPAEFDKQPGPSR